MPCSPCYFDIAAAPGYTAQMPVDTKHPDFEAHEREWDIMEDCASGELAVKAAGVHYLPRLYEQDREEYAAYVERAQFFNATDRTINALLGFIFRKNPTTTIDDSLTGFSQDCTMSGLTWYDYTKDSVQTVLRTGRMGTLIDFDAEGELRPYLVKYCADQIINWGTDRMLGKIMLSMLVLYEQDAKWIPLTPKEISDGPPDAYEHPLYDQWRVYTLKRDGTGLPYVQCDVYRLKKDETTSKPKEFVIVDQKFPTRRGVALTQIPFVFHGPNDGQPRVQKPPLLDLALVNISLYRTSADLENGRHVAGIPTPWAAGFEQSSGGDEGTGGKAKMLLGANVAWSSPDPKAKCGFLEFTGEGLGALDKAMEQKKSEMAALGAKMLQPDAAQAEAYETVAVRAAAEASALLSITVACTQTLTAVLQWVAWWNGTAPTLQEIDEATAGIELNTEFVVMSLPGDVITALLGLYNAGAVSFESLFWKLQQGEIIPPEADAEEERAKIDAQPPAMIGLQQAALDAKAKAKPPAGGGGGGA